MLIAKQNKEEVNGICAVKYKNIKAWLNWSFTCQYSFTFISDLKGIEAYPFPPALILVWEEQQLHFLSGTEGLFSVDTNFFVAC